MPHIDLSLIERDKKEVEEIVQSSPNDDVVHMSLYIKAVEATKASLDPLSLSGLRHTEIYLSYMCAMLGDHSARQLIFQSMDRLKEQYSKLELLQKSVSE